MKIRHWLLLAMIILGIPGAWTAHGELVISGTGPASSDPNKQDHSATLDALSTGDGSVIVSNLPASLKLNIKAPPFNAKGDAIRLTNATCNTGTTTLSCPAASFTAADIGKRFVLYSDTTNITWNLGTITAVAGSGTLTMSMQASNSFAGTATFLYGTDDTVPFQTALNTAWNAGGGSIFVPRGLYMISSNVVQRQYASEWSVLTLTNTDQYIYSPGQRTVELIGEIRPPHAYNIWNDAAPIAGSMLYCPTIPNNPAGHASVIGFNGATYFSKDELVLKNIAIRQPVNPRLTALYAYKSGSIVMDGCLIDVDYPAGFVSVPQVAPFVPATTIVDTNTVTGIWLQHSGDSADSRINDTFIFGYGCGVRAGEHAKLINVDAFWCGTGIEIAGGESTHISDVSGLGLHLLGNKIQLATSTNLVSSSCYFAGVDLETYDNVVQAVYDPQGALNGIFSYNGNTGHSFGNTPTNNLTVLSENNGTVAIGTNQTFYANSFQPIFALGFQTKAQIQGYGGAWHIPITGDADFRGVSASSAGGRSYPVNLISDNNTQQVVNIGGTLYRISPLNNTTNILSDWEAVSTKLPADTASVTFSVPSAGAEIVVNTVSTHSSFDVLLMRANGEDSTKNYTYAFQRNNNGTASASAGGPTNYVWLGYLQNRDSDPVVRGTYRINVFPQTNSPYGGGVDWQAAIINSSTNADAYTGTGLYVGNPITNVTLYLGSGNFASNSVFSIRRRK